MLNRKKAQRIADKLEEVKADIVALALDLKAADVLTRMQLKRVLSPSDLALLQSDTVKALLADNQATADAALMEECTKRAKKSWLWGLISRENVTTIGPTIEVTASDFVKMRR